MSASGLLSEAVCVTSYLTHAALSPACPTRTTTPGHAQPALSARLRSQDISADMYAVPWLLTMFARSLPLSTACRIWDRVLSEGERALFCAALALMQLLQPVLLVAGFEESLQLLQNLPSYPGAHSLTAASAKQRFWPNFSISA